MVAWYYTHHSQGVYVATCIECITAVRICDHITGCMSRILHILLPEVFTVGNAATPVSPLGIVSPANMALLDGVQRVVDKKWGEIGERVAGKTGRMACRLESAKASHPEFPLFASMLASMPSLSNGPPSSLCMCMTAVCPLHKSLSHTTKAISAYSHTVWLVYMSPPCTVVSLTHGCPSIVTV